VLFRLLEHAVKLWTQGKHKEAVHLACDFKLQKSLNEQVQALPTLVNTGKVDVAVHLVEGDAVLAAQLIPLMSTNQHVKTAGKLIETHSLDPFAFPAVITRMKKVAVRYYVNSQQDLSPSQLVDLMDDDPELLQILVEELEFRAGKKGQGVLAAQIVRDYPWLQERLRPETLANIRQIAGEKGDWRDADHFGPKDTEALAYPLDPGTVQFIGSEEALVSMELSGDVLGFDCEWRPAFIKFTQYPVSIFQIATRNCVYIIDLIALNGSPLLDQKLSAVFQNNSIVKLGLSFAEDRKLLIKSYPQVAAFEGAIMAYGDLQRMYQELFAGEQGSGGLVMLVQRFLQRKLCKGEQRSNWMRRPLRQAQLHYAALDAYVEILLWDKLVAETSALGEDASTHLSSLGAPDEEQRSAGVSKCKSCGQPGHKARDCPKCYRCHQHGHQAANCPS